MHPAVLAWLRHSFNHRMSIPSRSLSTATRHDLHRGCNGQADIGRTPRGSPGCAAQSRRVSKHIPSFNLRYFGDICFPNSFKDMYRTCKKIIRPGKFLVPARNHRGSGSSDCCARQLWRSQSRPACFPTPGPWASPSLSESLGGWEAEWNWIYHFLGFHHFHPANFPVNSVSGLARPSTYGSLIPCQLPWMNQVRRSRRLAKGRASS